MELQRRAWVRGIWEALKEILLQKLLTYKLRSSPLILPNHLATLNVIVTGATSGIGLQTARELVMAGANVVMACRNVNAANEIAQQWKSEVRQYGRTLNVKVMEVDLLSLNSVRQFAVEWDQLSMPLHILINNAGILRMGERQRFSEDDGIEEHFQVNHVAPALLTLLLLPSMLKATTWRVVSVNSLAHHWGQVDSKGWNSRIEEHKFSGTKAYGSSKLVHIMFLKALAINLVELGCNSVQCIAVHPGIVASNLVPGFKKKAFWMLDTSEGARSVLYCATSNDVVDNLDKGFAYYSSNCKPGKMSPLADKLEICLEIWEETLKILGLDDKYLSTSQI
ncbi:dehydrogenase/reductase SDR family member FEY-like [Humulus lupulus]|uniref:dehydrogenase/reductase SDR family member FEY-like n=1 Tax=Humulus lupulus TaxID=3486 RepID=UPI002B407667|nr:dehydrogenase/reductase SDR family member FEY-like [Humulus lupulus]